MFGSTARPALNLGRNVFRPGALTLWAAIFVAMAPAGVSAQTTGARNAPIREAAAKPTELQAKPLEGLEASGPPVELAEKLMLFGQFILHR
jgi:hypothetical protein